MTRHFNVFGETLLLEISDCKFVGVGQEVLDASLCAVVLQVVHQMGSVALDLLAARDCTEHNLGEPLRCERAEADSTDWTAVLDQR